LIRTLLDILRLRSGPQDLPAAPGLTVVLAIAWLGQGMVTDFAMDGPDTPPRSLFAILFQFVAVVVILRARGLAARIPQTLSALAGTGFLFGLAGLALLTGFDPENPQPGIALGYFGLFLWSLLVDGHIYRHAMSTKMALGVLVAVLIFAANLMLSRAAFG